MEDTFILEKRKRIVKLDDEHSFVMREMGAEAVRSYSHAVIDAGQKAKASLVTDKANLTLEEALRAVTDAELSLLMDLLKEPVDETKPATEEFCRGLSYSQRVGLFKLQNELNGMDELLKNLAGLLAV